MKNEFVPYDIALAMTQVGWGWHEGVMGWYCNTTQELRRDDNLPVGVIYAPLYQQAFRWFREKYNLTFNYLPLAENGHSYKVYEENKPICNQIITDSYEEAQDSCLRKLIDAINVNQVSILT